MATKPILIISTPCLIVDLSIRPRIMMAPNAVTSTMEAGPSPS